MLLIDTVTHPSIDALLALAAGDEPAGLRAHLIACAMCRELATSCGVPPVWTEASVELRVVPRAVYRRVRELHRGGMGRASLAVDLRLDREVVLKEMLARDEYADLVTYQRHRDRFEREARLTASLNHPSIVAVYEAGWWEDGEPFYAMPHVPGGTLTEAIAAKAPDLLPHVARAAEALGYAHGQGVVHRDVKPDNILVGGFGETVVIDWGLAGEGRLHGAPSGPLTTAGAGTAGYAAPEQSAGAEADPRMDVYALGVTLRDALQDDLHPELASIVARATAPDPAARFSDAKALADEISRFLQGILLESHRYSAWARVARWVARHRALVLTALAALVVVLGVSTIAVARVLAARSAEETALRRARGALASQLSVVPTRRLAALRAGLLATEGRAEEDLPAEARRGLLDAARAAPAAYRVGALGGCVATHAGRIYVVGEGRISAYALQQDEPIWSADHPLQTCRFLRVAPDGRQLVATAVDAAPVRTDLETRRSRPLGARAYLWTDAAWRGDTVVLGNDAGRWVEFDASGAQTREAELGAAIVALAARGDALAVATVTGAVTVWSGAGREPWFAAGRELVALRAVPEGWIVADAEGRVLELRAPGRVTELRPADGTRINQLDVSANALLVTRRFGGVEVRARDGALRHEAPGWSAAYFSPFSADGRRYLTIAPDRARVWVRDLADGRVVAEYRGSGGADDAGFVTPSTVLVVGRVENVVFDATTAPPRHDGEVTGLFVIDGRLFSAGLDGAIVEHHGTDARRVARLRAGVAGVEARSDHALLQDVDGRVWRFDGGELATSAATIGTATAALRWPLEGKEGRACRGTPGGLDCAEVGAPVTVTEVFGDRMVAGTVDGRVRRFPLSGPGARRVACATLARFDRPCPGTARSAE